LPIERRALVIVDDAPIMGGAEVFGLRVARVLTFPLAFLFFAVPFGEVLHPALMSFTANATVLGLRLTGVPVAVEGMSAAHPARGSAQAAQEQAEKRQPVVFA
jgi:hypothetical protein